MNWLRNLPIQRQLNLVVALTCLAVLVPMGTALILYEISDYRRSLREDTTALADVLARDTQAPLAFQDEEGARKTLMTLEARPDIQGACLYDSDGKIFAEYARKGASVNLPKAPPGDESHFGAHWLAITRPVLQSEKRIGMIYLQASLTEVDKRVLLSALVGLLVLVICLSAALFLSSKLQRTITQPIFALTETAKVVAERHDYSVRGDPRGGREMVLLTGAFNQMLTELEGQHQKQRIQLERLKLLEDTTRSIGERQDLASIYQVVLSRLEKHLPVDFACACGYDAASRSLEVSCLGAKSLSRAEAMNLSVAHPLPIDQNGLARCLRGHLVYEPDTSALEFRFPQRLAGAGCRSVVFAPLQVESQIFGVLIAARCQPAGFSSTDCEFLKQLSEHVALAAHQAQLYQALQRAFDELRQTQQAVMQQERLRALGQMASGIAHDINNAISPVSLYTESLLETEPNLSVRARGYLETIQRSIDDVAHTVSRMREFYRQREGKQAATSIAINDLVRQVVDLTRARWSDMPQQNGALIRLETELDPNLPMMPGVESEIREALVNLVFNAVDAMPQGGTLTLGTRLTPEADGKRRIAVEVRDTGIGMSEETRRRCLEPFFTTKGERGTGLGLAMVYGILQRHGGAIEIKSAVGHGTTFQLRFLVGAVVAENEPSETGSRPPLRQRILVVDDDPLLIRSLRDILEGDGHDVTSAPGGQEGIEAFRASCQTGVEAFAVVFTDLGMPGVDGRQVAAAVKTTSAQTPVILLTGWGERLLAEGENPPNVDVILSKPPKLRELRDALAKCLAGSRKGPTHDG